MTAHTHDGHHGNQRRVLWALLLTGGFMVAEVIGGVLSGSLALLADAGHMLTDTAALGLSWYAFHQSRRPASPQRSYGHHRFQVLAALINGGVLIGVAAWICIEAIERLFDPVEILGRIMLAIAVIGLVVNITAFAILNGGDRDNINIRGAALHVLGDLLGSLAAMVAAGVILLTGWTPIDPILSALVAALIVRSALVLVRQSWHVLMEGAPEWLDVARLRRELMEAVPGVRDVHHVHAWLLTPERPLMTLHATLDEDSDYDIALRRIQQILDDRFGIPHATVQLEREHCTNGQPTRNERDVDVPQRRYGN